MMRQISWQSICCLVAVANLCLFAEDSTILPTPEVDITAKINSAIVQLDAESFSDRETASKTLADLGAVALPALEQATMHESVEVAARAYGIIVKHFVNNGAMRLPARTSLEKLSQGKTAVSRRSQELLKPHVNANDTFTQTTRGFPIAGGVIRIGGGLRIVPPVPVLGDPFGAPALAPVEAGRVIKSISVSFHGDTKSVDMKAGEKRIKLTVKANKTIVGEITQPKDGKSETEKIDVKDASELQTKFPEAFKLYEKHLAIRDAPANKLGSAEAIKTQLEALRKQSETISKMDRMPTEARERVLKSLDTHLEKLEKDAAEIEKARSAE